METLLIITVLMLSLSCNDRNTKSIEKSEDLKATENSIPEKETKSDTTVVENYQTEVMLAEDILFNGKLRRYFTLKDFGIVFGKADSIKLLAEEEPCTYIFDTEIETNNMNDNKYYYKDGSRFENFNQKVAVDEFRFLKSNFILYEGMRLDSSTTKNDLQKIFPNAIKDIGTMDVYREGELQVIRLREDENNVSDGHINIFIKNGKLYFMHWWFPC